MYINAHTHISVQLRETEKAKIDKPVRNGQDNMCPQLVNLSEDPLMTECLVYYGMLSTVDST